MQTKLINCYRCGGSGYVNEFDDIPEAHPSYCQTCPECEGDGSILVDVVEVADVIREEEPCKLCNDGKGDHICPTCKKELERWQMFDKHELYEIRLALQSRYKVAQDYCNDYHLHPLDCLVKSLEELERIEKEKNKDTIGMLLDLDDSELPF